MRARAPGAKVFFFVIGSILPVLALFHGQGCQRTAGSETSVQGQQLAPGNGSGVEGKPEYYYFIDPSYCADQGLSGQKVRTEVRKVGSRFEFLRQDCLPGSQWASRQSFYSSGPSPEIIGFEGQILEKRDQVPNPATEDAYILAICRGLRFSPQGEKLAEVDGILRKSIKPGPAKTLSADFRALIPAEDFTSQKVDNFYLKTFITDVKSVRTFHPEEWLRFRATDHVPDDFLGLTPTDRARMLNISLFNGTYEKFGQMANGMIRVPSRYGDDNFFYVPAKCDFIASELQSMSLLP